MEPKDVQWGKRLAKAYYDKLFREYCICDLTYYKENKVAMRWRTEKEVVDGKGQFVCGEKHCNDSSELKSWEVNFAYIEEGTKKNALVKLRLCPRCSKHLNYHSKKKEVVKNADSNRDVESGLEGGEGDGKTTEDHFRKRNSSSSKKRNLNDFFNDLLE